MRRALGMQISESFLVVRLVADGPGTWWPLAVEVISR